MDVKSEKKRVLSLPNVLTFARLLFIPVILICLSFPNKQGSFLAAMFFGIAAVTDYLDGFFARKYDNVTVLGKLMDPVADKILVSATMIMLVPLGRIKLFSSFLPGVLCRKGGQIKIALPSGGMPGFFVDKECFCCRITNGTRE
ncbi:MAG: CDP-alcohol phosphatidyltransferase family protein [Thermodesulfobacteriota bacterium]